MDTTALKLLSEELKMLRKEKGRVCVSIIIPFNDSSPQLETGKQHLEKAIEALLQQLRLNHPTEANALITSINDLFEQIDAEHNEGGIGLFVSENVKYCIWFPFLVTEKIDVSNSFYLRDVLYKQQYSIPYYVLHFDKDAVRLYSGNQKQLLELKNKAFPLHYTNNDTYVATLNDFSADRPLHLARFERTVAETEKLESFFHEVDELLSLYLEGVDALILCGSRLYTSAFVNRCSCPGKIISIINGSPDWFNETPIFNIVWPVIEAFTHDKMINEISKLEDKIREGFAEEGITGVWQAVVEGLGIKLLVEKNLHIPGFFSGKSRDEFYFHRPKHSYEEITALTDVVQDVVEMALEKNIEVVFVEDGMLKEHQQIALITEF